MTTLITIQISDALGIRLGNYAQKNGCVTYMDAIEHLLDSCDSLTERPTPTPDGVAASEIYNDGRLEIVYHPAGEQNFEQALLRSRHRKVCIRLHYQNGDVETKQWNAQNFGEESSVSNNLRSGYLRGWRKRGLIKAEVSIKPF